MTEIDNFNIFDELDSIAFLLAKRRKNLSSMIASGEISSEEAIDSLFGDTNNFDL
jgi:hypothetical protein